MPTDTSNTQSFRTNRLKCKLIAESRGGPQNISNQQSVPQSLLLEVHQGQTDAIIHNATSAPTVDAGCCGNHCDASCAYITAFSVPVLDYNTNAIALGLPLTPVGYTSDSVVLGYTLPCNVDYIFTSIANGLSPLTILNYYMVRNIFIIDIGNNVNFFSFFIEENIGALLTPITVSGNILPCNLSFINKN